MYASPQDLIDRYGQEEQVQLTNRDDPEGESVVEAVAETAIKDASETADSYLARRHVLPLTSTPEVLKSHVCAIARYKLHDDHAPDRVKLDYDEALRWLKDIAQGRAVLRGTGTEESRQGPAGSKVLIDSRPPTFTKTSMGGY